MLSLLLGLGMSMHLMAYQASEQSFVQTLTVCEYTAKPAYVKWEWQQNDA